MRSNCFLVQESIYAWYGDDKELKTLQSALIKQIHLVDDKISGYRLTQRSQLMLWGQSPFIYGVIDSGYPPHQLNITSRNLFNFF